MISADEGAVVNLNNNCFFENDFKNLGLVNLGSQSVVGEISNNFGAKDDEGLKCDFVHFVSGTGEECQDFDLQECPIPGVDAPPVKPSVESSVEGPSLLLGAAVAVVYFV